MEKNKAIQLLERLQDPEPYEPMLTKDAYDAIQMAIDALSANGDTISRQAAIDALRAMQTYKLFAGDDMLLIDQAGAQTELMMLSPAQPEPSQVAKDIAKILENEQDMRVIGQERIRGHWVPVGGALYQCDQCGAVSLERKFCSDCGADMRGDKQMIYKRETGAYNRGYAQGYKDAKAERPERINGHWIIRETSSGDTEARCSHCGFTTLVDEPGNGLHMVSDLNFCPNCGADMRGEQNG